MRQRWSRLVGAPPYDAPITINASDLVGSERALMGSLDGGCSLTKRCRPRSRAAHCASTIADAGVGRVADVPDLALLDEVGDRAERLLDGEDESRRPPASALPTISSDSPSE